MVRKTVLVTGGLGFIGGGLCKYLYESGFKVLVGSSRENATLPSGLSGCLLSLVDLDNRESLRHLCAKADYVIHLASINSKDSLSDSIKAVKVNGIGTANLIDACILNNIEYFVYFSTAHIYGSPLAGKIDENVLPVPSHPYSISHRLAEDFLIKAVIENKMNGSILRLSNSVGLPLVKGSHSWQLFVNDICKQALTKQSIEIYSNAYIERDFLSLDSVYIAVESILKCKPKSKFPIFNLGSGITYDLLTIAQLVVNRCEVLFDFRPKLIYSKSFKIPSISLEFINKKFIDEVGYCPETDLISSIDEILEFCESQ